jgi:AraC-like DNA-binding protein
VTEEIARYWQHPALPGVDLLHARYVRHSFNKHTHQTYVIAVVTAGVEAFHYRGSVERAGPGSTILIDPDTVHTGHAGIPAGWSYRVLYPTVDVVARIGGARGTPGFPEPVVADQALARLLVQVQLTAERDDDLAAETMFRLAVARLLHRHAAPRRDQPRYAAGRATVARARDLLQARMADPPSLDELATAVGARPFPLLRAFRDVHGLPPHAWLTQQRVRRAMRLLATGTAPAEAAVEVGFVDQSHLTRHFRRIVGVPPGAYQRERLPRR